MGPPWGFELSILLGRVTLRDEASGLFPGPQRYVQIMAFMAVIVGLGLLSYTLWGFRYSLIRGYW